MGQPWLVIELELDSRVLGNTVFAFSPLSEVASSLKVLGDPVCPAVHRPWRDDVASRLRGLELSLLLALAGRGKWTPDFLYPTVSSPQIGRAHV